MWHEIERLFNRAFKYSFTRKKVLFLFPTLILCGLFIVVSHLVWLWAHPWVRASLAFIPAFLCSGVVMAAGIPLIRLYHDEVKEKPLLIRKTVQKSGVLMTSLFSLLSPLLIAYIALWLVLGMFYLLKNIPAIGELLGVVFSFGPFLLILGSLVISVGTLLLMFFMTPWIALKEASRWESVEAVFKQLKREPFIYAILLFLGVTPLLFVVALLTLAATLTGMTVVVTEGTWTITLQWFFIMIPFAAILAPVVIFFFNFAAESYAFLQRRGHQ